MLNQANIPAGKNQGDRAGLFAQINVGMNDIMTNLKHIDRKELKK